VVDGNFGWVCFVLLQTGFQVECVAKGHGLLNMQSAPPPSHIYHTCDQNWMANEIVSIV
jgi:hypothetical protein